MRRQMTKAKSPAGKKKEAQTQLNKHDEHRRGQCLPALLSGVLLNSHVNRNSEQQGQHCPLVAQTHQTRLQELHDGQGGAKHSRQA